MELVLEEKQSEFWEQCAQERFSQEETAELIVPDSCPDMRIIIDCWAELLLRGKECRTGGISVSGSVQAGLLFLAEGETTPRKLECQIPFTVQMERPELTQSSFCDYQGWIKSVDARMLNSRKAMLRVNLVSELAAWEHKSQSIPQLTEPTGDLQLLQREYPVLRTVDTAERAFILQEEAELPESLSPVVQLLGWSVKPRLQEQKLIGARIAFRGTLDLQLQYLAPDESLNTWATTIPFTQYADMGQEFPDAVSALNLCMTGRDLQNGDGGRRLYLNLNLLAQCRQSVYETLRVTEDLYSTQVETELKWKQIPLLSCIDARTLQQTVHEVINTQADSVECGRVYCGEPQQRRQAQQMQITVPLNVQMLCRSAGGEFLPQSGQLHADFTLDCAEQCRCEVHAEAADLYTSPTAGGVEVRCSVALSVSTWAQQELRAVSAVTTSERKGGEPRASLLLRRAEEGESLWSLAKSCATTINALMEANHLQEEELQPGELLLIPLHE